MSYDGITLYDVELLPHMIEQIKKVDTQECYSLNFHNHTDLQNEVLSIFVCYDNYVYPCCMVGSAVSRAKQDDYDGQQGHINDLLNVISENNYEEFSVKEKSLKTVLNSGIIHKTYYDHMKAGNPNAYCKLTCGRCTGSRSTYQVI